VGGVDASGSASLTTGNGEAPAAPLRADSLLDALQATDADGEPRHVTLTAADGRVLDADVRRAPNGRLLLAIDGLLADESEPLRELARQMAGVVDTGELLDILCAAAARQCGGNGAAVLKTAGADGEVVAATGPMSVARGQRFALSGSLAREVVRTREVVTVDDFSGTSRPLLRAVPELRLGPMLLGPLVAHDAMLGVLAVTRALDAPAFTKREAHRLRVIADHAALALWKAELLEQAQSADRAKSRFLATVSHELRTPLTALAGYEELLVDQVIGPLSENQLDVLERMRAVTHHLSVVIEEVLAFSSLEDGGEKVRVTDFLAADLVRATAAVIEPLARQKHLEYRYIVPDEPIRMTSDIDKIRQILVNLAGNAVKFTDRGEVRLELEHDDGVVKFIVCDTGIGIAPHDLSRLFRPFAQIDTGLTRRHGGTGLGLYISRRLAELLGGRIEVKSELGKGSIFTLVLPE
jgi:signal transduction histidine kinase